MSDKVLVYIIYASVVVMGILFGLGYSLDGSVTFFSGLFFLSGIYLLVKNGEFIASKEYRLVGIGVSVIIIGAMFKIMHWKYADTILGIGCLFCIAVYLIYLLRKFNRLKWIDWVKLLFAISFFLGRYLAVIHWGWGRELIDLNLIVFIVILIEYLNRKVWIASKSN